MRKLMMLFIAATLMVASLPAASARHRSGHLYLGYVEGEITFDFTNPKGCGAGFVTVTEASGWAARTGRTDMDSAHCYVPVGPPEDNLGTSQGGEMTLTARNGNEIYATYEVTVYGTSVIGDKIVAEGTMTFNGGTGRYEDATGSAYIRNVITFEGFTDPDWAARAFWIGRIDY
ncbi:MAG: hypothetical protein GY722_27385 [bacterium]|nr:hypothetical protein [bacterium]